MPRSKLHTGLPKTALSGVGEIAFYPEDSQFSKQAPKKASGKI